MGKTRILACAIGLALGAAGCGDDDDDLTTVQAGTGSVPIVDATVPIEGSAGTDGRGGQRRNDRGCEHA